MLFGSGGNGEGTGSGARLAVDWRIPAPITKEHQKYDQSRAA